MRKSSKEFASSFLLALNFNASAASMEIGTRKAKASERDKDVMIEMVTRF